MEETPGARDPPKMTSSPIRIEPATITASKSKTPNTPSTKPFTIADPPTADPSQPRLPRIGAFSRQRAFSYAPLVAGRRNLELGRQQQEEECKRRAEKKRAGELAKTAKKVAKK